MGSREPSLIPYLFLGVVLGLSIFAAGLYMESHTASAGVRGSLPEPTAPPR